MRNFLASTAIALSLGLGSAAIAQTAPTQTAAASAPQPAATTAKLATGATIYDAKGGVVGTIAALDAQHATIATATTKTKVKVPVANFALSEKGAVLGMTAAELDAAAGVKASAAASGSTPAPAAPSASAATPSGDTPTPPSTGDAKLSSGTTVVDSSGAAVGTIEAVSGDYATVATAKNKVRLPLTAFALTGNDAVIGMTAAELDAAAVAAAKPKG